MKRPDSVKIGTHTVPIIWDKKRLDSAGKKHHEFEKGSLLGLYSGIDGVIFMRPRKSKFETHNRETLLHEILHCAIDLFGVPVTELDDDEPLVASLSPVLMTVLIENPNIREYLFGEQP